jgi:phosphoribosylanthranilate isomerase
MAVKVKICGITNLQDAKAAVDMGADILGFNFYPPSPRFIEPDRALEIINKLPTFVDTAAVFVNAKIEQIRGISEQGYFNWIQLHGDETPEFCDSLLYFNVKTIKAIRVKNTGALETAGNYYTDAILLDAFDTKLYGGTGKTFDWSIISNIDKRIFLAGGIDPDNAARATETGVYGIDICSGIESEPGKKDHEKMKMFFKNIEHVR